MVTFWRNWSHLAFQSQQPFDNVCMSWFNTVLTCSRTVFPGLCKHNTSQSRTEPLCLMRALLAHSDWISPIISEHNYVLVSLLINYMTERSRRPLSTFKSRHWNNLICYWAKWDCDERKDFGHLNYKYICCPGLNTHLSLEILVLFIIKRIRQPQEKREERLTDEATGPDAPPLQHLIRVSCHTRIMSPCLLLGNLRKYANMEMIYMPLCWGWWGWWVL